MFAILIKGTPAIIDTLEECRAYAKELTTAPEFYRRIPVSDLDIIDMSTGEVITY